MYQAVKRSNGNGAGRVQRQFSILSMLYDQRFKTLKQEQAHSGEWAGWLTTYEIAAGIGMKPSAHLRNILHELLVDGFVNGAYAKHRSNRDKAMWKVASGTRNSDKWKAAFDAYLDGLQ